MSEIVSEILVLPVLSGGYAVFSAETVNIAVPPDFWLCMLFGIGVAEILSVVFILWRAFAGRR